MAWGPKDTEGWVKRKGGVCGLKTWGHREGGVNKMGNGLRSRGSLPCTVFWISRSREQKRASLPCSLGWDPAL